MRCTANMKDKDKYKCASCGATSKTQEDCCGEPMKKEKKK